MPVGARTAVLERDLQGSFGRVGLVRFNPFEDTGGNQSFALALLDGRGDGFVVSSLHSRTRHAAVREGDRRRARPRRRCPRRSPAALRQALAKPAPGAAG